MRICVLRLGGMGDILLSTPTVRALAEHFGTQEIDYFVGPGMSVALDGLPYVRDTIVFDRTRDVQPRAFFDLIRRVRAARYDLFLNLQPSIKTVAIQKLSGAKQQIVFQKNREKQSDGKVRHAIDDFSKEIKPLGVKVLDRQLDFYIPEAARQSLAQKFDLSTPYIAVNPAGTRDINRWPAERFAALFSALARAEPSFRLVLLGGPSDTALAEQIAGQTDVSLVNLCGKLTIKELGALLERSSCVVTGDTGPLHIASAVKAPIVCLSGAADPDRTGPTRPGDLVVINRELSCVPCQGRYCKRGDIACMAELPVAWVLDAVQRRIQR